MNWNRLEGSLDKLMDLVILTLPNIITGFAILFIGRYVIRFALGFINRRFEKRNVDISIRSFVISIIKFVLYALLILTAVSTMGIQTTSFIAVLSAFGLAVGMALQGSLSNFAGGVLILLFRPFEVGDYIDSANGSSGTVEKIDLLYTTLSNDDGIQVFSPNGTLANSVIKNFSKITNRRMQFTLTVSYDTNVKVAREAILAILKQDKRILAMPTPVVIVGDLLDGGLQIVVRAWATKEDFWATKGNIAEELQTVVENKNLSFPQATIKVLSDS